MILYKITCSNGHAYASWFKDAATFEMLSDSNRLECPHCHLKQMDRAIPLSYEGDNHLPFASSESQIHVVPPAMSGDAAMNTGSGSLLSLLEAHIVLRRLEEIRQQIEQYFNQFAENSLFRKKEEDVAEVKVENATPAEADVISPDGVDKADKTDTAPLPAPEAAVKKSTENA